jgi:hypothetical protein
MHRPSVWLSGDELSGEHSLPPFCVVCGEPAKLCRTTIWKKPPFIPSFRLARTRWRDSLAAVLPLCQAHEKYFTPLIARIDNALRWALLMTLIMPINALVLGVLTSAYFPAVFALCRPLAEMSAWGALALFVAMGLIDVWKMIFWDEGVHTDDITPAGILLHNASPKFAQAMAATHADEKPPPQWRQRLNQLLDEQCSDGDNKTPSHDVHGHDDGYDRPV